MSNQNFPPAGQFPPHGGQPQPYQPVPQKKSHLVRNIILGIIVLGILACGGCFAIVGLGANEVSKEIDKSIADEAGNDKPKTIREGASFTHDGYKVSAGWKVAEEEYSGTNVLGMKIKAVEADGASEDGRTAMLTFRFYKGSDVLLEVTCSSNEMQVGESSKMDCFGDGETVKRWDTIKVADAF